MIQEHGTVVIGSGGNVSEVRRRQLVPRQGLELRDIEHLVDRDGGPFRFATLIPQTETKPRYTEQSWRRG